MANVVMMRSPRAHTLSQYLQCYDTRWGERVTKNTAFPRGQGALDPSPERGYGYSKWIEHFAEAERSGLQGSATAFGYASGVGGGVGAAATLARCQCC